MLIEELKPAPYNPRKIGDDALRGLSRSMQEFGDIAGIIWNKRTGHLVAGHQRLEALKTRYGAERLTIQTNGKSMKIKAKGGPTFPVRVVEWDEITTKAANIAANSQHIAGHWSDGIGELVKDLDAAMPELTKSLRLDLLVKKAPDPGDLPDVEVAESFQIVVECKSEDGQQELYERLSKEGYECRVLTL